MCRRRSDLECGARHHLSSANKLPLGAPKLVTAFASCSAAFQCRRALESSKEACWFHRHDSLRNQPKKEKRTNRPALKPVGNVFEENASLIWPVGHFGLTNEQSASARLPSLHHALGNASFPGFGRVPGTFAQGFVFRVGAAGHGQGRRQAGQSQNPARLIGHQISKLLHY